LTTIKTEALLAIDRIGIQRLCYGQTMQDGVVFGSTADAVRQHPEMDSTIDNQHVFSYLFFHAVPSPGTIYHQQKNYCRDNTRISKMENWK